MSAHSAEELHAVAAKAMAALREVLRQSLDGEDRGIDILRVQEIDSASGGVAPSAGEINPMPACSGGVDAGRVPHIATLGDGERRRMLILLGIEKQLGCESIRLLEPALQ